MQTLLSCLLAGAAILPSWAHAQEPPAEEPPIFIQAARLIVGPGKVLEPGQVLVRDGLIASVGQDLEAPEGATVLEGQVVCAGFIDPWSALGVDAGSLQNAGTNMASRAADGVDVFNDGHLRREALEAGVTTVRVQIGRTASFAGIGAVLKLAGETRESALLLDEGAAGASIGLSTEGGGRFVQDANGNFSFVGGPQAADPFDRLTQVDRLANELEGGRKYAEALVEYRYELEEWEKEIAEKQEELDKDFKKAKKARDKDKKKAEEDGKEYKEKKYKEDNKPAPPKYDASKAAAGRIVNGEIPLVVQVHRNAEIRALLEATKRFGRMRMILAGGTESAHSAKDLASRGIPVVVLPALKSDIGKQEYDEYNGHDLTLAGRLSAAGVTVLLGSGGENPRATRDLPLFAAIAIGHGLDREKAFAAMTVKAAEALDVSDRVGTVEFGKDADLLILNGEPLVSTTRVEYVIADGDVVVSPEN